MFRRVFRSLWKDESGQDLADYCLLTALVALVAVGILIRVSGGVQNLWTVANANLTQGNQSASSSTVTGSGASNR